MKNITNQYSARQNKQGRILIKKTTDAYNRRTEKVLANMTKEDAARLAYAILSAIEGENL